MITKEDLLKLKDFYIKSNDELENIYKLIKCDLPPRYYMNLGIVEFIDYVMEEYIYENES